MTVVSRIMSDELSTLKFMNLRKFFDGDTKARIENIAIILGCSIKEAAKLSRKI